MISFATPDPLTVANPGHSFSAAEMTIINQSGNDFSLGTDSGFAVVISNGGGMFMGGAYVGQPPIGGLDAGSSGLRLLGMSFTLGSGPLQNLGYDVLVPISPPGQNPGEAQTVASLPGIAAPGGFAVTNPATYLVGGFGTDSVDLSAVFLPGFATLAVWQIG